MTKKTCKTCRYWNGDLAVVEADKNAVLALCIRHDSPFAYEMLSEHRSCDKHREADRSMAATEPEAA